MIRHDAIRRIDPIHVLLAQLARVSSCAGELLNLGKERHEHVGVVVGAFVLQDGNESLEAHTRVDVLRGKRSKGGVRLAVVLNEDEVPHLEPISSRLDTRE